jgi:hypothetical protein
MEQTSRRTFRITIWRPWLLAVIPLALLAAFGVIAALVSGKPAAVVGSLLGFAGVAGVLLLPIGLAVWVSRWHVDPSGIGGRNNMLVYSHLNWAEIESVEPWLIPGYRYVQVNGVDKRRAFWLPLFLTDMPGFRSTMMQYAPSGNPLRRYLEENPAL